jgi:hypothetical protein
MAIYDVFAVSVWGGRQYWQGFSLCTTLDNIKPWPGLKTLVRVESERQFKNRDGYEYSPGKLVRPLAA